MLHRLIYVSRCRLSPDKLDETVGDIVRASIRNNRAVDITGLLLVHDGHFVQALEGPTQAVMETFQRIGADPRHAQVQEIAMATAERRAFAGWNMCARRLSDGDDAILDTLAQRERFDPYGLTPDAALGLLLAVGGAQQGRREVVRI